jgi:hypothetical protein
MPKPQCAARGLSIVDRFQLDSRTASTRSPSGIATGMRRRTKLYKPIFSNVAIPLPLSRSRTRARAKARLSSYPGTLTSSGIGFIVD